MLPTLALAQQAGQHITRPGKPQTTTTSPSKKQTPSKKQSTSKQSKKQSTTRTPVGSSPVTTGSSQSRSTTQNKTFTINGVSFTMVKVDGGTFTMQEGSYSPHSVTLSSYYIGQTEVKQSLWEAVMGSNPSKYDIGPNLPVNYVSWDDCQIFVRKLSSLTGEDFCLPTEAQWEFAARGGNKSRGYMYSGSNNINEVAWFKESGKHHAHDVATKRPNELGIYDMSGNVAEWCQDWRDVSYSKSTKINPTGPDSGKYKVDRGGHSGSEAADCKVTYVSNYGPHDKLRIIGCRIALKVP